MRGHPPLLQLLVACSFTMACNVASAQVVIEGSLTDAVTGEPLPYATIQWVEHVKGTVSDLNGSFRVLRPAHADSLRASYVGYRDTVVSVNGNASPVVMRLTPAISQLTEVIVRPMEPEDYLKQVRRAMPRNYPNTGHGLRSYYREQMSENGQLIKHAEGAFLSALPGTAKKGQHQLLLYRQAKDIREVQFMRDKLDKKLARSKDPEGPDVNEVIAANFGGPAAILSLDVTGNELQFLDSNQYHKYRYAYGRESSYLGRPLLTIEYRSRGTVDHLRQRGTIHIDKATDAIVSIQEQGDLVVPLALEPLLFVFGLGIKEPTYGATIRYQLIGERWYPQNMQWRADVGLVKKKLFRKNDRAQFHVEQVFVVNSVQEGTLPEIAKEHRFDPEKPMAEQAHNDQGVHWGEVSVLP